MSWQATTLPPRRQFESYFRSAEVLLTVHRLLEAEQFDDADMVREIRRVLAVQEDEQLFLLLNNMFLGVVREEAELPASFFRPQNMALLLRQSIVAAYTAMEVYFPALLRQNLPVMILVRQRSFIPQDKEVTNFFRGFSLSLDEHLRIVEDLETQHEELGRALLRFIERQTIANPTGISVTLKLFGIEDPWERLGEHLGRRPTELSRQVEAFIKRRNDIIHRGDRASSTDDPTPRPIDFAWTSTHVDLIKHVVHACDSLVTRQVREYQALVERPMEASADG
jgi:hypothetical protein